jgi:hypothetical protein
MRWERRSKRDVRGRVFRFYTCGHRNGRQRFVGTAVRSRALAENGPFYLSRPVSLFFLFNLLAPL